MAEEGLNSTCSRSIQGFGFSKHRKEDIPCGDPRWILGSAWDFPPVVRLKFIPRNSGLNPKIPKMPRSNRNGIPKPSNISLFKKFSQPISGIFPPIFFTGKQSSEDMPTVFPLFPASTPFSLVFDAPHLDDLHPISQFCPSLPELLQGHRLLPSFPV